MAWETESDGSMSFLVHVTVVECEKDKRRVAASSMTQTAFPSLSDLIG